MYSRIVVIVESADVFHMYELEDVVDAERELVVWLLRVHHTAAVGEHHKDVALGVLLEERVVLVCQFSSQATVANILAPLEFLQQWYSVEYLAV